jgi:hypothetical protein
MFNQHVHQSNAGFLTRYAIVGSIIRILGQNWTHGQMQGRAAILEDGRNKQDEGGKNVKCILQQSLQIV